MGLTDCIRLVSAPHHGDSSLPSSSQKSLVLSSSKSVMMYVKSLSSPVNPIIVVLFTRRMRSRLLYRFVLP
jgi:hypothetical protein